MSIPKIIHFIAPKDQSRWHPIWHRCFESWQNHFSDFEMKVWGDDNREVEQLIETYYPQYLSSFRAFPYDVMRWNFSRFVLLHHYGGIYADMDIFCYQNFCEELEKHNLFLIENILAETVNGEFPFEICLMASKANHPYYKDCMDNSVEQYRTIGHLFDKDSIDDEWLIVTLTDSIAIQSRNIHDPAQISLLPYYLYNNRAASYNKSFYTKHMRSSAWNYSFLPDKYLIIDNLMFAISSQDDSVAKLIAKQKNILKLGIYNHMKTLITKEL
jgi:mannosyltransferase OCH1-like enzyme